ncbi:MAG: AAA family ATPase [Thermodesulfobacteriota bacterium]
MYNTFFNFKQEPFNLTPDPKFVYLSPGHQSALEHMLYGVDQKKGFVLISGDIGAGKTTMTRLLLDNLEGKAQTALIFNTFLNEIELLRAINREFGLPAEGDSGEGLVRGLNRFLIGQMQNGGNAVLILDEAQNLSVPVLEQIRMLSNLETDDQKLIQMILVGQPEIIRTLARPDLAQLNQRVTVRCHLAPLGQEDTVRYIHHRLAVAGPKALARFDPPSFRLIHRFARGVPRRINALCDRALLVAFSKGSHKVTTAFIRQAQQELTTGVGMSNNGAWFRRLFPRRSLSALTLAFGAAALAAAGWPL